MAVRARRWVVAAMATLALALGLTAQRYGYHRDELYFRALPLRWGYVDQPPLLPALASLTTLVADQPWALRLPAVVCAVASVPLLVAVCRELGGGPGARVLTAWGVAFGTFTLSFGHLLLTASLDLVLWPAILLVVLRVVRTGDHRRWLLAGALVGVGTYGKWLIVYLVVAVLVGLLMMGPRSVLRTRWLAAAAALAVLIALPNVIFQLTHGLPQLAMGRALSTDNGNDVRIALGPILLIMVGPLLCWIWIAGLVSLLRRPERRPQRFLVITLVVVLAATFVGGSQFYYPYPVLTVIFATGAVPVAAWARTAGRRRLVITLTALHVITNVVINLPVLPARWLPATPIPAANQGVADQIGWPRYVAQIDAVTAAARRDDPGAVVFTSNYGEAGALDRFSVAGAPTVSAHNALWDLGPPPAATRTVVVVGGQYAQLTALFERCEVRDRLDDGVGVDNEEQGQPVGVCTGPREGWTTLWPRLRHLG